MTAIQPKCKLHPEHVVRKCCCACSLTPVCDVCCRNIHHSHKTCSLDDAFSLRKKSIEHYHLRENKTLKLLNSTLSDIPTRRKHYTTNADDVINRIRQRGEELKKEIDKIVQSMATSCQSIHQHDLESLTNLERQIKDTQNDIEQRLSSINNLLESNNKMEVICCSINLHETDVTRLQQKNTDSALKNFKLNSINAVTLTDLFGKLPEIEHATSSSIASNNVVMDRGLDHTSDTSDYYKSRQSKSKIPDTDIGNTKGTSQKKTEMHLRLTDMESTSHSDGDSADCISRQSKSKIPDTNTGNTAGTSQKKTEMHLSLTDVESTSDFAQEMLSPCNTKPHYILSLHPTVQTQYQHTSYISSISACSNKNQAWINCHAQKTVELHNDKGLKLNSVSSDRVIKSMGLSVLTGKIWVACSDMSIREQSEGKLKIAFKTPDYVTCLCISSEEEVLVGMSGEAKIVRYNRKGEAMKTLDQSRPGKQFITVPNRIQENHDNGQIAIINADSDVVVLDKYMEPVYSYKGEADGTSKDGFKPSDLCFDAGQNLLISNKVGRRVLLLDTSGKFLRVLLTDSLEPLALGIQACDGLLWVGFGNKIVKTYRYLE